jgi:hypothetical protein
LQITDNPDELAAFLTALRGPIVFDGCTGAGKSTLALGMATRLGCEAIEVDRFVDKKLGVYVEALRIDKLRPLVEAALKAAPVVLLDAVCARAVVERLGLSAAAFVYVQRVSLAGVPGDLDMMDADEEGQVVNRPYFSDLDREILHYHAYYRPIGSADFIYRRTE